MAVCKACHHHRRDDLDFKLVAGTPLRVLSAEFALSLGALHRHKDHVRSLIRTRTDEEREIHGTDLLTRVQKLADEAIGILESAKAEKNLKAATAAVCAAVRCLELTGRLDGSLAQPHAPGVRISLTQHRHVHVGKPDDDLELATLISEATNGFDPLQLARLKSLVDSLSCDKDVICEPQIIDCKPL